jgi:DNA-binding NarL/FixJ family response regulator
VALRDSYGYGEGCVEKRILLIDDDTLFRETFAQALQQALAADRLDVAFVEAGTLAEARSGFREGWLDAALIDVWLPDGAGLELVHELNNSAASRIPTLVLSAYLDYAVVSRAIDERARGALSKVVSMPEAVGAIKRLTDAGRFEA